MKKLFVIGALILLASTTCLAQRQFSKPLKSTSESKLGFSNYNVGVKMGCPWGFMTKSDLHETVNDGNFGYLLGLTAEWNFGRWSMGLESTFAQKGTKMHNEVPYQIGLSVPSGTLKTKYQVAYNVVTVRIPFTFYFKGVVKEDKVVPYVFAGLETDIPLGFNLNLWPFSYESPSMAITQQFDGPLGEDPLPLKEEPFYPGINVSAVAGLGLMTQVRLENSSIIFKLDAAYNQGLMNLAVPTQEAWKWPFESQEKRIFANDVEINFSIVFPIKKTLHDACYFFER